MPKAKKWNDEKLIEAVKNSTSMRQTLLYLGLNPGGGGNYSIIPARIKKLELDTSHWLGQGHLKGKTHNWGVKKLLSEILVEKSLYVCSNSLRKRLIREKQLEDKCSVCSISDWQGQKLTLHLDHINGIRNDNRLENLRLLCPNCHSQTETYCGRNKRRNNLVRTTGLEPVRSNDQLGLSQSRIPVPPRPRKEYLCIDCQKPITNKSKRCPNCYHIFSKTFIKPTKIVWPSPDEMKKLVWEKSTLQIAEQLNVSDNAVAKFCKKNNIEKPPRGYWAKKQYGKI